MSSSTGPAWPYVSFVSLVAKSSVASQSISVAVKSNCGSSCRKVSQSRSIVASLLTKAGGEAPTQFGQFGEWRGRLGDSSDELSGPGRFSPGLCRGIIVRTVEEWDHNRDPSASVVFRRLGSLPPIEDAPGRGGPIWSWAGRTTGRCRCRCIYAGSGSAPATVPMGCTEWSPNWGKVSHQVRRCSGWTGSESGFGVFWLY